MELLAKNVTGESERYGDPHCYHMGTVHYSMNKSRFAHCVLINIDSTIIVLQA